MDVLIILGFIAIALIYVMVSSAANIMMIMKYGEDWRDDLDE